MDQTRRLAQLEFVDVRVPASARLGSAGADALDYRRRMLRDQPRYLAVLDLLRQKSGPPPNGVGPGKKRGRGL